MPPLKLACQRPRGVIVIAVNGEMDATNRAQLEAYVRDLPVDLARGMVFDLSGVPFMDSSGLHVLLRCATDCLRNGGTVHLAGVQPLPARLFELTGVAAYVPVHDTVETAVAALTAAGHSL
ncbi:STAS domain-containing protein [Nonomuraea sp. NPDC004580]|uniref:STAS domain-containing protein n=1 Tax=Nonomuraea sp. NPDC004580 TaxID=3154552 RepID=UPI0033A719FB